jgi:tetratricopeptide (TPR) repeat protein
MHASELRRAPLETIVALLLTAALHAANQLDLQKLLEACGDAANAQADSACHEVIRRKVWETGVAFPHSREFYERLGRGLEAEREWEIAIRVYREGIQRFADVAEFHFRLGRILLREIGAYEEALGPLSEAVRRRAGFVEAETAYGDALRLTGRPEEASIQYQNVLNVRPNDVEAHRGFAAALLDLGQADRAVSEVNVAIHLRPNDGWLLILRGKALAKSGKSQEALQSFRTALGLADTEEREVRCEMASVLRDLGRMREAGEECEKALHAPALKHGATCRCAP